jgi:hypothetical protein
MRRKNLSKAEEISFWKHRKIIFRKLRKEFSQKLRIESFGSCGKIFQEAEKRIFRNLKKESFLI